MSEDNSEHEINVNHTRVQAIQVPMSANQIKAAMETSLCAGDIFAEFENHEQKEFLNSVMDELEDQNIPEGQQQREYAIKKASMKGLEEAAKLASEKGIADYLRRHPEANGLGFTFSGKAYIEKSTRINYPLVFTNLLDCLLDRNSGFTTQKAILDSVKKFTSIKELNANIWNMPLKRFMKALLYKRLKNHSMQLSLAGCSNMSDVRKAIDTYYAKRQAVHKLKLDLTITLKEVIVNGTSHKITKVSSGAYEYRKIRMTVNGKRTWLNVDELKVLFGLAV